MKTPIWKPIAIALAVGLVHLGIMGYLLGKTVTTAISQTAYNILSFPLVYLDRLNYWGSVPKVLDFDWMPFLLVGNSLLWGAVIAALWSWWWARGRANPTAAH